MRVDLEVLVECGDLDLRGRAGAVLVVIERTGILVVYDPFFPILRGLALREHIRLELHALRRVFSKPGEDLVLKLERVIFRDEVVDTIDVLRVAQLRIEYEHVPAGAAIELVVAGAAVRPGYEPLLGLGQARAAATCAEAKWLHLDLRRAG